MSQKETNNICNYSGMLIGLPIVILYFLARKITERAFAHNLKMRTFICAKTIVYIRCWHHGNLQQVGGSLDYTIHFKNCM